MRKTFITILGLFMYLCAHAQSQNFLDALAEGKILLSIKSVGGHSGQCVRIKFERLTDKPFKLVVPAGHVFANSDSLYQDIVVLKDEEVTLTQKNHSVLLYGACAEGKNAGPKENMAFNLGQMSQGNLLKMAAYIAKEKLWAHEEVQQAIWCITDSNSVASLRHPGLLAMACQLMNVPKPEYRLNYAKPRPANTQRVVRPQPAMPAPEPLSVEGEFLYQSNVNTEVSILVKNEANETVRTIYDKHPHPPGLGKYSFYFKTNKLPKGNYRVVLYDGTVEKKVIKVRY